MSYHKEYISGLCPESDSWVVNQICGELDSRDKQIEELKEIKAAVEFYFGRSRCFEAVEQYRAENS